jgi:very-short-patch-repair endonuclease
VAAGSPLPGEWEWSFRRQVVIGEKFIVDFVAPRETLVVEVDGRAYHERRHAADARRDRKLARLGYRVLRLDTDFGHP